MKREHYRTIAAVIIPILVSIVPIFTSISEQVVYIALLTILSIYLSIIYNSLRKNSDEILKKVGVIIENLNKKAKIESVREFDFYPSFEDKIKNADTRVYISYFDNKDPTKSHNEPKKQYYQEIESLTKSKESEGVEFRRIVRGIPQLSDWIEEMIKCYDGHSNFSLACLPDDEPEEPLKSHVAVQLVDHDITYFVAVGEQDENSGPRDCYINSQELNQQWERYYNRIWNDCDVLMRKGIKQERKLADFREKIEAMEEYE